METGLGLIATVPLGGSHRSVIADRASSEAVAVLKMRRGYGLGTIDPADLLLAERQTHDLFRTELVSRTEALRAITRIMIDSHSIWIGDDL